MAKMSRENAREIDLLNIPTLEECVNILLKFQKRGESVYVNFNGHKLYSCDVTMDSAYQEITGKTKAELDKSREEYLKKWEQEEAKKEAEAKAKIPAWIEKGSAYIYPERMGKWEECVRTRAGDLYHGIDLDLALKLMEKLESGSSMDEIKEILNGQEIECAYMVRQILLNFAKRGPEIYESTAWGELSDEDKKAIADKKKENAELDELHRDEASAKRRNRNEEQEIIELSMEKKKITDEISDIEGKLQALKGKALDDKHKGPEK